MVQQDKFILPPAKILVISGSFCKVDKNCVLLAYYAASTNYTASSGTRCVITWKNVVLT